MRPAKPKAAAPPRKLTALEAAPLDFAEVLLVEGLADVEEEGEVADDEAPGDVDVGKGTVEVRVTP